MIISGTERHRLVLVDPAAHRIVWLDWEGRIEREITNAYGCFDVFALPNGQVLYPHFGSSNAPSDGFSLVDPDGSVALIYHTQGEVFSCQPLPNGNVLVGELRSTRRTEVSPMGEVVLEIPVSYEGNPHECLRAVRKVGDSYYAVSPGAQSIFRFSQDGALEQTYHTHPDTFGMVILPNGNLVYACMSGAYGLDPDGNEVWSLTDADVPEMNIRWLLGVQLLSNGNLVFTNWLGHGHTDEGIQCFEVNHEKQVVWYLDGRGTFLQPAAVQILDEEAGAVCYRPMK
ncbi:MAG: hypothetical protein J6B55_09170 [Clostridia bacterium]|nr:hypothetical protein [Clostridia bacterium]